MSFLLNGLSLGIDWNCGNNVPQVGGNPLAIVAQQFDVRANPTTGLITGSVYGNNQILCGNVLSTQWLVTEYITANDTDSPARELASEILKPGCRFDACLHRVVVLTPFHNKCRKVTILTVAAAHSPLLQLHGMERQSAMCRSLMGDLVLGSFSYSLINPTRSHSE
jgi:hypothetical protein